MMGDDVLNGEGHSIGKRAQHQQQGQASSGITTQTIQFCNPKTTYIHKNQHVYGNGTA